MKRIIPVFLLKGKRLVKGTNFKSHIDVGDPVSQAMIYDAQGADEIAIVDIEASQEKRIINPDLINEMIKKCHLPIAAGGGIASLEDARRCFKAGADKIIVNSAAIINPRLIADLANEFGSQSVLLSIDVKINSNGKNEIYTNSGRKKNNVDLNSFLKSSVEKGAGEIILTSINKEGTLTGFDLNLYQSIKGLVDVPIIASGGAGCYNDMVELFNKRDVDACGLGKMLFLRDYDIVRIKSYLIGQHISVREA